MSSHLNPRPQSQATQSQVTRYGTPSQSTPTFHIKVLNPSNTSHKRDGKIHTLRNIIQEDLDSQNQIKDVVFSQRGEEVVHPPLEYQWRLDTFTALINFGTTIDWMLTMLGNWLVGVRRWPSGVRVLTVRVSRSMF